MKRFVALFSAALILCSLLSGCSDDPLGTVFVSYSHSLADEPVVNEKIFELEGNANAIRIDFEVPEAGYIKMNGYDMTNYKEWPDEEPTAFVDFIDKDGKALFEDVEISYGYVDKYLLDAGKVTAEITFKNASSQMNRVALSWAFAPENTETAELTLDEASAAVADENGTARFSLVTDSHGVYNVSASEACVDEWDCSFRIENENGENVSGDLSIHGTEWTSRVVFLPKGTYTVIVSEIESVASCTVQKFGDGEDVILEDEENLTVPVTFGFTLLNCGERKAKFTADGSATSLYIVTGGSETYYDSTHTTDVRITDSDGNVVFEETCEDIHNVDISEYSGEYTITIIPNGSCVVEIITK